MWGGRYTRAWKKTGAYKNRHWLFFFFYHTHPDGVNAHITTKNASIFLTLFSLSFLFQHSRNLVALRLVVGQDIELCGRGGGEVLLLQLLRPVAAGGRRRRSRVASTQFLYTSYCRACARGVLGCLPPTDWSNMAWHWKWNCSACWSYRHLSRSMWNISHFHWQTSFCRDGQRQIF